MRNTARGRKEESLLPQGLYRGDMLYYVVLDEYTLLRISNSGVVRLSIYPSYTGLNVAMWLQEIL